MLVRAYREWVRHLNRADEKPLELWLVRGSGEHRIFAARSQTAQGIVYTVTYRATKHGEFITCTCPGAHYGLRCKHAGAALAFVHPQEFRNLIRESAT